MRGPEKWSTSVKDVYAVTEGEFERCRRWHTMNFFDVEGIRVKFVLEDKLLQVIESLFMRSL